MKKLLIASMAAALTAGVWATDVTYTKLKEGFEADTTFATDSLWDKSSMATDDVYTPTAYASYSEKYTYSTTTAAVSGGPGSQYLKLETSSNAVLRRNFAENAGAVTVDADNSYVVDTLVKFTATDDAPTVTTGDKFILWLQSADDDTSTSSDSTSSTSTTTPTLMVTCGKIDEAGSLVTDNDGNVVPATIALNANVSADQWARVSVKTIKFYAGGDSDVGTLGFVVYVDGVAVAASANDYAALFNTTPTPADEMTAQGADYYSKQMVFPCLISGDAQENNPKALTSVGFEGTGAIDDLMIVKSGDEDAPSFTIWTAPTSFTVSFAQVGLPEDTAWKMANLTVNKDGTVAEQTAPEVAGYTLVGWYSDSSCTSEFKFGEGGNTITAATTIYVKYKAVVNPVAPGETVTGTSEEAAIVALVSAGIKDPFTGITDEQKTAYKALFEATATGSGTDWTATWTLTEAAETTLTKAADDALAATLAGVLDGETTVSIKGVAQPGIYYTVLKSETLTATEYTVVDWVQATSADLTLTLPTKGDAAQCFYKIGVTAVDSTSATPAE